MLKFINRRSIFNSVTEVLYCVKFVALSTILMLLAPANIFAQTMPGDPECPISGESVTCTGDVSDGISSTSTAITDFNINNLTSPITADGNGILIQNFGTEDVSVDIDDSVNITVIDNISDGDSTPAGAVSYTHLTLPTILLV